MSQARIFKVDAQNPEFALIKEGAKVLREGGLVVIPTETVYGIAANALNKNSLQRLYEIKQRSRDKPFTLHVAEKRAVEDYCLDIAPSCYRLIEEFWPGPLTVLLKSREQGLVGLRMPNHKVAQGLIVLAGVPLVCPSANISGKPSPASFKEAVADLGGLVDLAFDAGDTSIGIESSIVDCSVEPVALVRQGAIAKEDILRIAQRKTVLFVCTGNSCRSVMAQAYLQALLKEKGRSDVEVVSAGVMLLGGFGPSQPTIEVLEREGIDVRGHRSQRITLEMIRKSDMIVAMEKLHEQRVLEIAPEAKKRLFLLKEFAKIDDGDLNISDPIGKPLGDYEQVFAVIKEAVMRISTML